MTYSKDNYLRALQGLLPTGEVWPRDDSATLTRVLRSLAATPARLDARAEALLVDIFPATTAELLPEWEASLGLPDPCTGPLPTIQQRQAAVVARLVGRGSHTVAGFIALALTLGYVVTITEFAPFRVGLGRVGQPLNGEAWAHTWQVTAPTVTVTAFRTGLSAVGEPLRSWGNALLLCELQRIAPAHTTLILGFA